VDPLRGGDVARSESLEIFDTVMACVNCLSAKFELRGGWTEELADEVHAFVIRKLSFCGVMVPLAFWGGVMCDERADDGWCG
jgi:hypothetical protein